MFETLAKAAGGPKATGQSGRVLDLMIELSGELAELRDRGVTDVAERIGKLATEIKQIYVDSASRASAAIAILRGAEDGWVRDRREREGRKMTSELMKGASAEELAAFDAMFPGARGADGN